MKKTIRHCERLKGVKQSLFTIIKYRLLRRKAPRNDKKVKLFGGSYFSIMSRMTLMSEASGLKDKYWLKYSFAFGLLFILL